MRAGTQAAAAHGSPVRAPGIWIRRLARSSVRVDSALVGDGETLAAFCSTPLQDDAAVLRRHANSETVSLLSPTGVRLISSLALHVVSSFNRDPAGARASAHDVRDITAHLAARSVGETSILAVAKRQCQRTWNPPSRSGDLDIDKKVGAVTPRSPQFWPPSVLHSRVADGPGRIHDRHPLRYVPPRFPQLWKSLWKSPMGPCSFEETWPRFLADSQAFPSDSTVLPSRTTSRFLLPVSPP